MVYSFVPFSHLIQVFIKISLTKLDNYYYFEYSDFWPHFYNYNRNVSDDISFGFLQVFYVELETSYRISNLTLHLNLRSRLLKSAIKK